VTQVLRRLLASLLAIGRTQLELVALSVEAERRRLVRLWWLATLTLWLALVAVALGLTALLLWLEPPQRAAAAGGGALLFALASAVAALAGFRARRRPRSSP
jgi:uncharacterized membrane protein YqjE